MAANAANTTFTREQVELIARASAKYAVDEAFHRMNLENRRGPDDDIQKEIIICQKDYVNALL